MPDRQMKTLLWIDDNEKLVDASTPVFLENGFSVLKATNTSRALTILREEAIDGVLLDVRLRGNENGLELLQEIHHRHPNLRVVIFTGYPEYDDQFVAEKLGALLYFEKIRKSIPVHPAKQRRFFDTLHRAFTEESEHISNPSNASLKRSKIEPQVFVGSSSESLDIGYALQENLEHDAQITVWTQGIFDLSAFTLDSLIRAVSTFDFGIFVFSPDDILKIRAQQYRTVRDNVLFELGLFIGTLGRERNFMVLPTRVADFHLPTDLLGLTPSTFVADRPDGNLMAALGPACNKIRRAIRKLGIIPR